MAFSARTENVQFHPQWGILLSRLRRKRHLMMFGEMHCGRNVNAREAMGGGARTLSS